MAPYVGLPEGAFLEVAKAVVATLEADNGAGGLTELTGNLFQNNLPEKTVNTIEYEFAGDYGKYAETQLPAIVVWVQGDSEGDDPQGRYRDFRIGFTVYHKSQDLEKTDDTTARVAERLKQLVRLQRQTLSIGGGFGLAAGTVPGYDVAGGHRLAIGDVIFARGGTKKNRDDKVQAPFHSFGMMDLRFGVPVRYTDIC